MWLGMALSLVLLALQPAEAQTSDEEKAAEKAAKAADKRAEIDKVAQETLDLLFQENPEARVLYDRCYGYAVFDSRKMALLLKSGGGVGVAIDKSSGAETYMRMRSLGVGVGLGVELFQAVFLFEDKARFTEFVEDGWVVESTAAASAGEEGASAQAAATDTETAAAGTGSKGGFSEGVAIFRFTEKGLMASADISGTKYWKDEKLNAQ